MKTIIPVKLFSNEFKDFRVFEQILRDLGVDDGIIAQATGVRIFPYSSFEWDWQIYRSGDMQWRNSLKYSSHGYISNFFHWIFMIIVPKLKNDK